jgi:hypothetical protein
VAIAVKALIDVVDAIPPLDVPADLTEFLLRLRGPTLFKLRGRSSQRRRAVSVMLHGNEPSGFAAVHALLRAGDVPAVDTLIFVGAVESAREPPPFSRRMLPGRRDLNRCFHGPFLDPDGELAAELLALLRAEHPEALVDLHNNTGHNPCYGLGLHLDGPHLALGALFATKYVHTQLRLGTLVEAMDSVAPSVTIECGRAGDPAADAAAEAGLRRFLHAERLDQVVVTPEHLTVLVDPVRVRVATGTALAFSAEPDSSVPLTLHPAIDRHNFQLVPAGTPVGWLRRDAPWPFEAIDDRGEDISRELFQRDGEVLLLASSRIPIMMTTSPAAVAADCLCYMARAR